MRRRTECPALTPRYRVIPVPDFDSSAKPAADSKAQVAKRPGGSTVSIQRWGGSGHLQAPETSGGHHISAEIAGGLIRAQQPLGPEEPAVQPLSARVVHDNPDDRDLLAAPVSATVQDARLTTAGNDLQGLLDELSGHCAVSPGGVVATSGLQRRRRAAKGSLPGGVHFIAMPLEAAHVAAMSHAAARHVPAGQP